MYLDVDPLQYAFDPDIGFSLMHRGNISLFTLQLELSDERKSAVLSDWLDRKIHVTRDHTADQKGYEDFFSEFKKRVRIPYRYAEAIYRSAYMHHFYSSDARAKFWRRWEPQLDRTLGVPPWIEDQLQKYHPPVGDLP
ncbi:MAG: hypothetical protein J6386_22780 [Candidatus Synoicihabitans palmerolidicus]|nr:hypothetical protein [Candidatus Synoicihabitans palmerolidicus]